MSRNRKSTNTGSGRAFWWVPWLVGVVGCVNAGEDRVLGITATGTVRGLVYVDQNGTRRLEAAVDQPLAGVGVRLLVWGTRRSAARGTSDGEGRVGLNDVPVGRYVLEVDDTTLGDALQVVRIDTSEVTLLPHDSVAVTVAVSYPIVSIAQARALPVGTRVFIEGIALNAFGVFGDTTVHLASGSAAIRATRVRRTTLFAGDSVRLRGTVATRNGQRTLDDVTPFFLDLAGVPAAPKVTTLEAATADGGRLDAALVRVTKATVVDTASVAEGVRVTVDDGSGSLRAVFDDDINFGLTGIAPDSVLTLTGLLVPNGSGEWFLKPRSPGDVTTP